ncbi:MAG: DUF1987 domain-containing protein [Bacteroidales bacterium]|nr:DUF1987 domain-containing protein [Bacteroidales bacterium]MBQ5539340.1 DUF1987 domain-containing protein [Bacteroidales bacterium]MBR4677962.1 DUF1987 domain-containing protein [Bacteroidales bacterium]MEE3448581.1 DUF1987 domain-containing protein [Bacteroidales bacterium]
MLEKLYIESTTTTPRICFDTENGKFVISGRSLPEDTEGFFAPVINWLEDYSKAPGEETEIEINLDYYNSTSLKKIADILFLLKEMQKNTGKKVSVIWAYEDGDDSSQENGEDLCYALDLPLELRVKTYDEDE